ncbi:MAG: hypothetical protein BYD32DRAFT_148298 [Podila humilis]|nr:MAG: hypothetical protein BYD32DRAFT_148298 [Podila humilis]
MAVGQLFDSLLLFLPVSYIDGTSCHHFPVSWASSTSSNRTILGLPLQKSMPPGCSLFYSLFSHNFYIPSLLLPPTPGNWPWSFRSFFFFFFFFDFAPNFTSFGKGTHLNCVLKAIWG